MNCGSSLGRSASSALVQVITEGRDAAEEVLIRLVCLCADKAARALPRLHAVDRPESRH